MSQSHTHNMSPQKVTLTPSPRHPHPTHTPNQMDANLASKKNKTYRRDIQPLFISLHGLHSTWNSIPPSILQNSIIILGIPRSSIFPRKKSKDKLETWINYPWISQMNLSTNFKRMLAIKESQGKLFWSERTEKEDEKVLSTNDEMKSECSKSSEASRPIPLRLSLTDELEEAPSLPYDDSLSLEVSDCSSISCDYSMASASKRYRFRVFVFFACQIIRNLLRFVYICEFRDRSRKVHPNWIALDKSMGGVLCLNYDYWDNLDEEDLIFCSDKEKVSCEISHIAPYTLFSHPRR